jgi:hypothetical protein
MTNRSGRPCGNHPIRGAAWCPVHFALGVRDEQMKTERGRHEAERDQWVREMRASLHAVN